jgi:hypothetical protein
MKDRYFASTTDDHYSLGPFDNKDDAIQDAKSEFADEVLEGATIYIGKSKPYLLKISGQSIVDMVGNDAYDELYEDALDGWCSRVSLDEVNRLGDELTKVFHRWLKRNKQQYCFDLIHVVEELEPPKVSP